MSQEIELYSRLTDPLLAIEKIGSIFAKSGLFGVEKTETGMVLAMECLATRKSPSQILREYHIIENRLSDRADSMLAKFNSRGGKHKIISRTDEKAEVELSLNGEVNRFCLTWEQAQKEPFVHAKEGFKKNWRTPRARMQTMWARVVSDGVRAMDPGAVAGIYTPEEIEDEMGIPAKEIVLPQTAPAAQTESAAQTAPKRGRPAKTQEPPPPIDVPITVVKTEPNPAPESPKPNEAAPKPSESAPIKFVATSKENGELSTETIAHLLGLFDGIEKEVTNFLKSKPAWGCTGDKLDTLKLDKAQLIIDKFDIFLGNAALRMSADKVAEHCKKVGWVKPQ